jgi:hypothetical protein
VTDAPAPRPATEFFRHEVRRDGRGIVVLRGLRDGNAVVVEAEVYPRQDDLASEPLRRPFPFASEVQAMRFLEEALVALEYLGCVVTV